MGTFYCNISMPRPMILIVFACTIGLSLGGNKCSEWDSKCCDRRADCAEKVGAFSGVCYIKEFNNFDWDSDEPWNAWHADGSCCLSCEKAQGGETGDSSCMFGNRAEYCKTKTSADCADSKVEYDCCEVCGYLSDQ